MNQPPRTISTMGPEVPQDFPLASYEAVHAVVVLRVGESAWFEYVPAWNAVAVRFRSAVHDTESFKATAEREGIGARPDVRFEEERALFGFWSCPGSVDGELLSRSSLRRRRGGY